MTSPSAAQPVIATPTGPGSQRPARDPLRGLLIVLIVAVTAVALAVGALAAIVWIRTQPPVVPTGPAVDLSAEVRVTQGMAAASLLLPQSTEAVTVTPDAGKTWRATVGFGQTVRVDVVLSTQGQDDETGELGSATCTLTRSDGTPVSTATVSVQNATASCSWTNNVVG